MDNTWKRIEDSHNRIIEEIIKFRKTAWNITDEEAEKIRSENYFNKIGVQNND